MAETPEAPDQQSAGSTPAPTLSAPVPIPLAPPAQAAPAAPQLSTPIPVGQPAQEPQDLSTPEPVAVPGPISDAGTQKLNWIGKILGPAEDTSLGDMLAAGRRIVEGPNTLEAKKSEGWADQPGTENESWLRRKAEILGDRAGTSIFRFENAITPEEAAAHPQQAAFLKTLATRVMDPLTTPTSVALMISTFGLSALPGLAETALISAGVDAGTAAKIGLTAKLGLKGLGTYFTLGQIEQVFKEVPETVKLTMDGHYPEAAALAISAIVNGKFALEGAHEVIHGAGKNSVSPGTERGAMAHEDYNNAVHEDQAARQTGVARADMIADLGEKHPNVENREWATEFAQAHAEAGNDDQHALDLMGKRREQTLKGQTPVEKAMSEQGGEVPLEKETKPAEAAPTVQPNYVYRARDVGEQGVPSESHSQATASQQEAEGYLDSRGNIQGKPQEIVRIDLNNLKPEDYTVVKGPNGNDWIKFNHPLDEAAVERVNAAEESAPKPTADNGTSVHALKNTITAPKAAEAQGLSSEEAKTNAQAPATGTAIDWTNPAAKHINELTAAVAQAEEAAKAHIFTPEERADLAEQQNPNRSISQKLKDHVKLINEMTRRLGIEAQRVGVLGKNQLRDWFVPQQWDFDDSADPTKARLFDSYHEGQMAGNVPKNKDYFALMSDYYRKMTNRIADAKMVDNLKTGRTANGLPLAVSGGFVEGQRVSAEGPQDHILTDDEIKQQTKNGQLAENIRNGSIVKQSDGSYKVDASKYIAAKNLHEVVPIGPTPIPPDILKAMTEDGSLAKLEQKGLVYKDAQGNYIPKTQLYARVPVYLHPDIADHFNEVVKPTYVYPNTAFGRASKFYDDATGNMKSLLLSFSPFHRVTESLRMMESLGLFKGAKLAAQTNINSAPFLGEFLRDHGIFQPPAIDYNKLTPIQEDAIYHGVLAADPMGRGTDVVAEGLSAGNEKNWGGKVYKAIDTGIQKVAKGLGASDETAAYIARNLNLQNILTKSVFGPQGMITSAKFSLYEAKKPAIADRIRMDHPDWSPAEVDKQAGDIAARWVNNKFGGLNYTLLGRAMSDQRLLRRIALAPDFLESTGRSIFDVMGPYGREMGLKLLQFNIAHALAAAGINLALHHDPDDHSAKDILRDSHILDHPYGVIGADGKTVYGLRTTVEDFLHAMSEPKQFIESRVNPAVRAANEMWTQRNLYGRAETAGEAAEAIPRAVIPIQFQNALGLGPNTTTEPNATDQFMKSIGVQAKPNRTAAEDLAIQKVNAKLMGTMSRTGPARAKAQLKFNAEDNLRTALSNQKAAKKIGYSPEEMAVYDKRVEDAQKALGALERAKVITPDEARNISKDAGHSRLLSIFKSLDYNDAMDVWDSANDEEKIELGPIMTAKYAGFAQKMGKEGATTDNQALRQRFVQASRDLSEIQSRPIPPPKQPKTAAKTQEKASAPAGAPALSTPQPVLSIPLPVSLEPPKAPPVYKTGDYTPIINKAAAKYGVDPGLVQAVIKRESAGQPNAQSNKGARGLMQLEPITARQYGVTDINDPYQNIDAGVHYLADLLKEYNGDEKKALAAYNAGPTAVHKYGGVPPYKETQDYVNAISNR